MKIIINKYRIIQAVLTAFIFLTNACTLDYVNPNAPTDEEALNSRDGLIALSIGMRQYYSTSGLNALLLTPGTTARETKGITTFTNIIEIEAGGTELPNYNGNVLRVWSRMYRVIGTAEDIIDNVPGVLNSDDAEMSASLTAHAKLFKAMALGGLATSFEQAPASTQYDGLAPFASRQQLLTTAVALLNEAATALDANPPSSEVTSRMLGGDVDLVNCVHAMRARFNLMAGNYQAAIDAANEVDLASGSQFTYTSESINPIYQDVIISANYLPRENFGLPASLVEADDERLDFYLAEPDVTVDGEVLKTLTGFFNEQDKPIPVYIPDEMRLIRAEANLRLNGAAAITGAVADVDAVRTQTSGDPFDIYANLPAYSGPLTVDDVLTEIYRQRAAELFLSGLRLEDSRRFGRPAPPDDLSERNRNFYPYPSQERATNTNTPGDPAI